MNPTDNQNPPKRTRAEANRENAAKSTGPRTPEGKKTASLNAFRHGLSGQVFIMPGEDMEAYKRFSAGYHADLKPKGDLELNLVQSIVDSNWQLNRARAMESHVLALAFDDRCDKTITHYSQTHAAVAIALGLTKRAPDLNTLSLHQQRLARTLSKHIKEFREIQAVRLEKERKIMEEAARMLLLHKHENSPPVQEADGAQLQAPQYDPTLDGFVFSTLQIQLYIDREDRRRRALKLEVERLNAA